MAAKKRCNLIKSCIITSKQRCANTRNRLLVTRSLLRDTENVEHSKHFKKLFDRTYSYSTDINLPGVNITVKLTIAPVGMKGHGEILIFAVLS